MKLRDRLDAIRKYFTKADGGVFVPPMDGFDHSKWSKTMLEQMAQNISMAGMFEPPKPEAVCPITKALIIQQLSDLSVKYPNLSLRELISVAMRHGVKDDYELAENLEAIKVNGVSEAPMTATEIQIRSRHALRGQAARMDHAQDAMNYAMRGLLDNARMANSARRITRAQLAGSSDPADMNGSCDVK